MEQIGIRELRQHASRWLAKVKAGASIQITDRGHPVARLVPITPAELDRDALVTTGQLIPATNPRVALDPAALVAGQPLTPILDEQRSER